MDSELTALPTTSRNPLSLAAHHLVELTTDQRNLHSRRAGLGFYGSFEQETRVCHLPSTTESAVPTLNADRPRPVVNQATSKGAPSPEPPPPGSRTDG